MAQVGGLPRPALENTLDPTKKKVSFSEILIEKKVDAGFICLKEITKKNMEQVIKFVVYTIYFIEKSLKKNRITLKKSFVLWAHILRRLYVICNHQICILNIFRDH